MSSAIGDVFVKAIVNSPFHPLLGERFAVIAVPGRKTGKRYSIPINVAREGDIFTVVSLRSRTWWRNLRGGAGAHLRVSGKLLSVQGEVLEKRHEVVEGLTGYFKRYPSHAKYFGVRLAADGQPSQEDLDRVGGERVIVRLRAT